jgi:chromosome partitioning protein
MHVISFVTQKGGTGKSSLSVSLAVAAEVAGERVCILDLDPQGTTVSWYATRTADTPAVLDHNQAGALPETLARLQAAGFTLAVIDTPGIDSHATRGAMRAASLCLIPVRPSEADVKATMPTIRALEGMSQPYALVINQAAANRQTRLTTAVTMRLASEGPVLPVPVAARIDHQYAYALGLGVHEYAPDGKAAAEIAELWQCCKKRMEPGHVIEQTKRCA